MITVIDKERCYGCEACRQVCPKQGISMKEDEEGFLYPFVDQTSCIDCGACENICISNQKGKKDSGVKAAYIENEKLKSNFEVSNYFDDAKFLADVLQSFEFDKIAKVSLLCPAFDAESLTYPLFKRFEKDASVLLSGPKWVDLIAKGASKGAAVEVVGKIYGASFDERMAFGNYLNDVDLLKSCRFSFAVENAHAALKKIAGKICPSNDQDGVAQTLIEWFDLKI